MRSYWTRVKSYAERRKIGVLQARSAPSFRRDERIIASGGGIGSERIRAERLMRALQREGLEIGRDKTWRDYIRKKSRR